ncbi:MAG: transposase family protein [Patescibacteria group bacterium]
MLTYKKLFDNPGKLLRFTGLTVIQFEVLSKRLEPLWIKSETERLSRDGRIRGIGGGRKYSLSSIENKLLLILVFYRTYLSHEVLSWIFNLDGSNICRLIKKLVPLIEKIADPNLSFALKSIKHRKRRLGFEEFIRLYPDLVEIVIDSTEQKRRRPSNKRKQKNFYSGKKHQHGFKTQIAIDSKGQIIDISKTYPARVHDKTVLMKEHTLDKLPPEIKKLLDKGYVKIEKIYPDHKISIPIKCNRWKRTLTRSEKIKNTKLSKRRIKVEHIFSRMKKYQILYQTYRSKDKDYNRHFRNIASLCNFRFSYKELESS